MYRILVSDKLGESGLKRLDAAADATYDMKTGLSPEELKAILPEYDALIVRSGTKVTADLLSAAEKLQVIGRAGMGVDNIDVPAATERGVVVMNTPGANSIATAELTLALMLAASRHVAQADASLKAGEWRRSEFVGRQLYGKTLGIIGFGRIGRLVAERAQAFGMEVLAYDPYVTEEVARDLGVLLVDLDVLLGQSDYVTLHTAVSPESERMINATTLSQMKDGAILVNAARGKLVDEAALAEALTSGKLSAAAVDVYSKEPPDTDNPLIGLPNVIDTPHLGASTVEAQQAVGEQIVDQVLAALRGTDFSNAVNMPFDLSDDFNAVLPYMELAERIGRLHAGWTAPQPITQLEIEVHGDTVSRLVRAIAAGILKGVLSLDSDIPVNYINAPALAHARGIQTRQTIGINNRDYPNLVACRAIWEGGERLVSGVLFGGTEPRIVQVNEYRLEARPEGVVLLLQNHDVPGVIGQVGTILAAYDVNIGEWRLGRIEPGSDALSFINLDSKPSAAVLKALGEISAVTQVTVLDL